MINVSDILNKCKNPANPFVSDFDIKYAIDQINRLLNHGIASKSQRQKADDDILILKSKLRN